MPVIWLFGFAAVLEVVTGVALIASPGLAAQLLLDQDLAGAGIALTRLAGAALFSLGIGSWVGRREAPSGSAMASMLTYNLLATICLAYVAVAGAHAGPLLWPAVVLHAALTALFARASFSRPA